MGDSSAAEKGQASMIPFHAKRRSFVSHDSSVDKILSGDDILKCAPKGWARAAALQSLSTGLSHQRRYDVLWHRLLLNEQGKISGMEDILEQLDKADEEPNPEIRRQAYAKYYHFLSSCSCSQDKHAESLLLIHQLQQPPQTSSWEFENLHYIFKNNEALRGIDWSFISLRDDYLSTRTDRTFAALVYGDAPLASLFRWVFKSRSGGDAEGNNIYLHTGGIESFKKGLVAAASGILLMVPVGILLLKPMDSGKALAVVVCFSAAFVFVMVLLEQKFDKMLIGFSAYSAVLVT
ncbi:hypothetical protein F5Y13DRAFT_183737 [Hypoxylon sp. FL1857]|nr:hypothetical protein F5Y13DRAFT_183737 [Hypoxylon sp. FL1857]